MDNEFNVCSECGTENEKDYVFCKNCGARLLKEERSQDNPQFNPNFSHTHKTYNTNTSDTSGYSAPEYKPYNVILDEIQGVPTEEICDFVGKKAPKIVPKFSRMELSRSSVSWCWPAAILGFLFGPIGAGIWFCYRKMYKIGMLLVTLGVAVALLVGVIGGKSAFSPSGSFIAEGDETAFSEIFEDIFEADDMRASVATAVNDFTTVLTGVLAGLFSYKFYLKFTVDKIRQYRTLVADPRYYRIGLAVYGGVSGGMAVLALVLGAVGETFAAYIGTLI